MGSGRTVELAHHFIIVDAHLIQLEEFGDRFLIPLLGGVEKTPALVHLFFFGMRRGPSFHAIPSAKSAARFSRPSVDGRTKIAELYQNPQLFENAGGRVW